MTMTMSMSMTSSTIPASNPSAPAPAPAPAVPDVVVHPPNVHLSNSFHFKHHHHQELMDEFSREAAQLQTHILLSQNLTPKLDSQSSFCGNESWESQVCEGNNPNCRENKVRAARRATTASSDHGQFDDDDDDGEEEEYDDDQEDEEDDAETDAGQCEQSLDPSYLKRLRRMLSNRDSARRSRKRKQEQLADLEFQAEQLKGENDSLFKQLTNAHQLFRDAGRNNRVLKSDVQTLRDKVKLAEVMLDGGSSTCGLNRLVQSHLTSQQPVSTHNHNRGWVVNVSPSITGHGDDFSGLTLFGNSASLGLAEVDFSNAHMNNIGVGGDAVSCISQVWP